MKDLFLDVERLIQEDKLDEARSAITKALTEEELPNETKGELYIALALAYMDTLEGLRVGVGDVLESTKKEIEALPERERVVTEAASLLEVREDLKA